MPHRIITKLKALEALEFASHTGTENPYLNEGSPDIPEDAMDLIDGIIDDCCRIFGTRKRPEQQQLRIMLEHGYELSFDGPTIGVMWQTTVIHTHKGKIAIR